MKKVLYIMLFLVLGMSLTAQSVWDGSREAISSGSGTESDPYLIENAQPEDCPRKRYTEAAS